MSDAADLEAVTQVQQQIWSKGDFAMVASIVYNASREPRRGARDRPRRARARRRLRQRQRRDRGGAAHLGRHGRRRLRPGPARARPRARRGRAARGRVRRGRRRRSCPSRTPSFDVAMSIFGAMFAPDQPKTAVGAAAGGQARRPDRDGATGPPTAASATMFKTIAKHAPPPPGRRLAAALGHRGARCASCSATASPTCGSSAASRASRSARPTTTSSSSAPTSARSQMAFERVGAEGEQALDRRPAGVPRGGEHRRRPGAGARGRVPARSIATRA